MVKNVKKSKTFRFSEAELALLESLKGEDTYAETLVRGLESLRDGRNNAPSNKELVSMIEARLRQP